jgi:uncharacterized protein (TIGR02246 family)
MKAYGMLGVLLAAAVALGVNPACSKEGEEHERAEQQKPADLRPASEDAVRATAAAWNQAFIAKDVEKIVSFYADDASLFPPGSGIDTGKEAIHAAWVALVTTPGFSASINTTKVEAARSGDLAYEEGTYLLTTKVKGELKAEKGKYVVVWKKQADGNWKAVADIFNADQ